MMSSPVNSSIHYTHRYHHLPLSLTQLIQGARRAAGATMQPGGLVQNQTAPLSCLSHQRSCYFLRWLVDGTRPTEV